MGRPWHLEAPGPLASDCGSPYSARIRRPRKPESKRGKLPMPPLEPKWDDDDDDDDSDDDDDGGYQGCCPHVRSEWLGIKGLPTRAL